MNAGRRLIYDRRVLPIRAVLVAVFFVLACGPSSSSSSTGGGTGTTSVAGSTSSSGDPSAGESTGGTASTGLATSSSSTGAADETGPIEPPDLGRPPDTCELPARGNASVMATSDVGDVALSAVVFAEAYDATCWPVYRLVLAPTVADLEEVIARVEAGASPLEGLVIDLAVPPAGAVPGDWQGPFELSTNMMAWLGTAMADVTAVTLLDAMPPAIEGSLTGMNGFGEMQGDFSAKYCARVRGAPCQRR